MLHHALAHTPPPLPSPLCPLRLYHAGTVIVIDVSQSVEMDHPRALEFLRMDAQNVTDYFDRSGCVVMTPREVFDFTVHTSLNGPAEEEAFVDAALTRAMEADRDDALYRIGGGGAALDITRSSSSSSEGGGQPSRAAPGASNTAASAAAAGATSDDISGSARHTLRRNAEAVEAAVFMSSDIPRSLMEVRDVVAEVAKLRAGDTAGIYHAAMTGVAEPPHQQTARVAAAAAARTSSSSSAAAAASLGGVPASSSLPSSSSSSLQRTVLKATTTAVEVDVDVDRLSASLQRQKLSVHGSSAHAVSSSSTTIVASPKVASALRGDGGGSNELDSATAALDRLTLLNDVTQSSQPRSVRFDEQQPSPTGAADASAAPAAPAVVLLRGPDDATAARTAASDDADGSSSSSSDASDSGMDEEEEGAEDDEEDWEGGERGGRQREVFFVKKFASKEEKAAHKTAVKEAKREKRKTKVPKSVKKRHVKANK